ncbi:MAG: cysteine desulfurase-like protein [Gemmataceae bacterium]|jgi:cysteine desulfurase family protein (TIGR01976 family)|nr:cysteine desulfurase-like protein [Gemmataceae bacterium]
MSIRLARLARAQFPALARLHHGRPLIFFDGPAGSQVPYRVIAAISNYYLKHNANHGGAFITSQESDASTDQARQACADLLGSNDPNEIIFGANMTTLTFALSRAIAQTWKAGDEIIVSRLDHDANVTPWVRAAEERGVVVRHIEIDPVDCTLNLESFHRCLTDRTKLLAVGCVSNAVGTRNPFREMIASAKQVGAWVFLDAVHHAPHLAMDVSAWGADFVCCSAYKFFGPHVGILWGKREHLETLRPYKVRPCPETLPDRWMTGTQNFAAIAGVAAAIDYLSDIGASFGETGSRRQRLWKAFEAIEDYEKQLSQYLLQTIAQAGPFWIYGITEPSRLQQRVPTISFTSRTKSPKEIVQGLAERGICAWAGNFYALPLTEALQVEPQGLVRIGALHYNTFEEIEMFGKALKELA